MGSSSYSYEVVSSAFNEDFYEQCVIEHMTEELGYTHLYGPNVPRTSEEYRVCSCPEFLKIP